jgi:hypothetical protein
MRFTIAALAATLLVSIAIPADAQSLTVRTYRAAAVSDVDLEMARVVAADTLRSAGVAVEWVACDAIDRCATPLAATELAVRFVRVPASRPRRGVPPLGDSLVDMHTGTGALATIYVDRIATLAAAYDVPHAELLGRAVAHEIAHLLIGSRDHAPTGLMRAMWSPEMIRAGNDADWQFSDADIRALHAGMSAVRPSMAAGGQ